MEYKRLGDSEMMVSRICLGCMSFGDPSNGRDVREWTVKENDSRALIRRALELGINFFDTANVYSGGTSEEITGRALKDFTRRDEVFLATKVYYPMDGIPDSGGLSRRAIIHELEQSLKRLKTDYIDLYITHRWDNSVPVDEIMQTLDDVIKSGKVRYIGASNMPAWRFAKAQHIAETNGWAKFISMQCPYNLIYRENEREMIPLCEDQNVGITPWSPLARGKLSREPVEQTLRSSTDKAADIFFPLTAKGDNEIIRRLGEIAERRAVYRSQIALAWLLSKQCVSSAIVGVTKIEHLDQAVDSIAVNLSRNEIEYLEKPYEAHSSICFA